ncbi:MAG TPA: choice-of-anchor Q domain-containing protein [Polyangiaceae bacterium]
MMQRHQQPSCSLFSSAGTELITLLAILGCTWALSACDFQRTLRVTSLQDGESGSLRRIIDSVNTRGHRPATVELPSGTHELTRCRVDDGNIGGDIDILSDAPVTLVARGSNVVIRQTCPGERVLDVHGEHLLTVVGVTITGGALIAPDPSDPARGGGIRTLGDVKLERATISGNSASGAPGNALPGATPVNGGAAQGGGIFAAGSLHASDSTLASNRAQGGAGPDAPSADAAAASGGWAEGGGAYAGRGISFTGGSATDNQALGGDGGHSATRPGGGGLVRGGGIAQKSSSASSVGVTGATFSNNRAEGGDSGNLTTAVAAGVTPLPPGGNASGGALAASGALRVSNVTTTQNQALGGRSTRDAGLIRGGCNFVPECIPALAGSAFGGAFSTTASARITASSVTGNQAASGDAFFLCFGMACGFVGSDAAPAAGGAVWAGAALTLEGGSYGQNVVRQGIGLPVPDGLARGGAAAAEGAVRVRDATFSANSAVRGHGGAVSGGELSLTNTTFTENTAEGRGGAVDAETLQAQQLTATGNRAGGSGGGALIATGPATIRDASISNNTVDSQQFLSQQLAAGGAGVSVGGHLLLERSEVLGNVGGGAARQGFQGGPITFQGGGVRAGSLEASAVTIANNRIGGYTLTVEGPFSALRRGVTGGGAIASTGSVSLVNTTLSANEVAPLPVSAPSGFESNRGASALAQELGLDHVTVSGNTGAPSFHARVFATQRSVAVAPEGQPVCASGVSVESAAYNWFSDASCALPSGTNQQESAAFLLGPLMDNGGPVATQLPGLASVLRDRIPESACPVPVDARGVTRPQGAACDIGAVEIQDIAGTGSADLALTFVDPPASVIPGEDVALELQIANRGPNASAPTVIVEAPADVTISSLSASAAGTCTNRAPFLCSWSSAIAPGARATIMIGARVGSEVTSSVLWRAEIVVPALAPPFEDDAAELTTPISLRAGVVLDVSFDHEYSPQGVVNVVAISLRNEGPSNAVGTTEQPIQLLFHAAPGVHAVPRGPTTFVGSFAPSSTPFGAVQFAISAEAPPPAQLGTIELRAEASAQPPLPSIPLIAADLELVAERAAEAQEPGSPLSFNVSVTNQGPGTATDVRVSLAGAVNITWAPSAGSVELEQFEFVWTIPTLSPGQSARLDGVVERTTADSVLYTSVSSRALDLNFTNDAVNLNLSPAAAGTADLQINDFDIVPGSEPNQSVIRAMLTNAGPSAASGSPERPILLYLTADVPMIRATVSAPSWTCDVAFSGPCTSPLPVPAGASIPVEFVVEGAIPVPLGMHVESDLTPDSRPVNNSRYFGVPGQ